PPFHAGAPPRSIKFSICSKAATVCGDEKVERVGLTQRSTTSPPFPFTQVSHELGTLLPKPSKPQRETVPSAPFCVSLRAAWMKPSQVQSSGGLPRPASLTWALL